MSPVFDTPGDETALASVPAPAPESNASDAPTDEEIAQAEAEAKAAEEAAKAKANAERIAKMNAAKAAKKAAEASLNAPAPAPAPAAPESAPTPAPATASVPTAPAVAAKVKLTPAELSELHEETGVKPSKEDIKTEKDMRDYLMAKPKVSVVIPLSPGEKPGSTESVSVNGVVLTIRKGTMVSVPKPFAEQIMNFTNIQMENGTVGNDFAIEAGSDKAKVLGA